MTFARIALLIILSVWVAIALQSCSTARQLTKVLDRELDSDFSRHFYGFMLYDPTTHAVLYENNSDKFFTPASNTKILTLAASLHHLGEGRMPSALYAIHGDTSYIWGLGDPTTLHPAFENNHILTDSLRTWNNPVTICRPGQDLAPYGDGWAWDDYHYSFQPEKHHLPLYGNVVRLTYDSSTQYLPSLHPFLHTLDTVESDQIDLRRALHDNTFTLFMPHGATPSYKEITLDRPMRPTEDVWNTLLYQETNLHISHSSSCPQRNPDIDTLYGAYLDTIYRKMMWESDNLIAEQLLLAIGASKMKSMDTRDIIDRLLGTPPFTEVAQGLTCWRDGSGLSRYNKLSPALLTHLLDHLYRTQGMPGISTYFASSNNTKSTLAHWYPTPKPDGSPHIYAKTGSLTGVHCLSGYLVAKTGKIYIFSFMHNNFTTSSAPIKVSMRNILELLHDHL